jgi:hypothetical protein
MGGAVNPVEVDALADQCPSTGIFPQPAFHLHLSLKWVWVSTPLHQPVAIIFVCIDGAILAPPFNVFSNMVHMRLQDINLNCIYFALLVGNSLKESMNSSNSFRFRLARRNLTM